MAPALDPWLFCLLDEASSPEREPSVKQQYSAMQKVALEGIGDIESLEVGLKPLLTEPIIWMVPSVRKKVHFLHSFQTNEDSGPYFTGLSGFSLSATLLTVKSDDLACGLIGNSLTKRTAVIELPTVKQFLGITKPGELLFLKGESGRHVSDLKGSSVISFFRPGMLTAARLNIRGSADAHTVLFDLIVSVKGHFGKEIDQVPEVWKSSFERLWVMGNGWTNTVTMARPKPSDKVEDHYGEKVLKLQKYLHPSVWGADSQRDRIAEQLEEDWTQDPDDGDSTRLTRNTVTPSASQWLL